jgi:hypothetical protein
VGRGPARHVQGFCIGTLMGMAVEVLLARYVVADCGITFFVKRLHTLHVPCNKAVLATAAVTVQSSARIIYLKVWLESADVAGNQSVAVVATFEQGFISVPTVKEIRGISDCFNR